MCSTDSSLPIMTYSNSVEVLLDALFATLPLEGSDCQVDHSPLEGKLSSVAQEGHHTVLGRLGRLLCLLCHVAQLPGQRAPVHRPAWTGSNTDHLLTVIQQVLCKLGCTFRTLTCKGTLQEREWPRVFGLLNSHSGKVCFITPCHVIARRSARHGHELQCAC